MSVVVRLPEDLHENVKRIASLQGRQFADVLEEAWAQYLENNREHLAATFEEAAVLLRSGDRASLSEFAGRSRDARAAGAARAARSARS
jgi:predicted DNA-binding protein